MTGVQVAVIAVYALLCLVLPAAVTFSLGRPAVREASRRGRVVVAAAAYVALFLVLAALGFILSVYSSIAIGCAFDPGPDCEHVFANKPMI